MSVRRKIYVLLVAVWLAATAFGQDTAKGGAASAPLPSGVKVLFAPEDNIEAMTIRLINAADAQILINQHAITNPAILRALIDAFAVRKVYVAVVLERNPPIGNYRTPEYLAQNGIPVYYTATVAGGMNDNRYMIIDRQIVMTGSYEWTLASRNKNNGNVLIVTEPTIAMSYINHFAYAVKRGTIVNQVSNPTSP